MRGFLELIMRCHERGGRWPVKPKGPFPVPRRTEAARPPLSPAIVVAVVVLLWRDTNGRIAELGCTVAALSATVADVGRRLATLEGRITGWQDRKHSPAAE